MEAWRVNHIGIVVKNLDRTVEHYSTMCGWGPWHIHTFAPPALRDPTVRGKPTHYTMKSAMTRVGSVGYELIEPLEGPSIYREFLEKRGEGLHHVGCYDAVNAEDMKKTLGTLKQMGIEVLQSGKFRDEIRDSEFYYIDTESILGVIYEMRRFGEVGKGDVK